jgi:uncharacterized membrane protein
MLALNMHEGALTTCLLALLLGCVAGMRTFTAPTLVSWITRLGVLHLSDTWLAFMGYRWTPWVLTLLAIGELVADQLPSTPSRTAPSGFTARIVSGAVSGAAVGSAAGTMAGGMIAGVAGAVIGTFGGHAFRARLAASFRRDRPAAFIEDAIALGGALVIGMALR